MDNKFTADRFKQHLHYDWYKYVACAIVGIFVFVLAYSWAGNYRDYESLEVMLTCYDWYDSDFCADAIEYLNKNVEGNSVKQIAIQNISAQSGYWGEAISGYGFGKRTSFLIIPESKISEYASTFMCMYMVDVNANNYNNDVWKRIIPSELRDFYYVPESAVELLDKIAVSDNDEKREKLMEELNLINENVYFAVNSKGVQGVYALRVDNLPNIGSAMKFDHEDTDYEKYYLVMHYRNSNVGQYGINKKTMNHYESFYLIKFFLNRYGVNNDER